MSNAHLLLSLVSSLICLLTDEIADVLRRPTRQVHGWIVNHDAAQARRTARPRR